MHSTTIAVSGYSGGVILQQTGMLWQKQWGAYVVSGWPVRSCGLRRTAKRPSLPPVGSEEQRWYSFSHIVTGQAENNSHRSGTEIEELGTCVVDVATPAFGHNYNVERDKLFSLLVVNRMALKFGINAAFLELRNAGARAVPFPFGVYAFVDFRSAGPTLVAQQHEIVVHINHLGLKSARSTAFCGKGDVWPRTRSTKWKRANLSTRSRLTFRLAPLIGCSGRKARASDSRNQA